MNFEFLKSKAFWTIVVFVIVNSINANISLIPAQYVGPINVLLGLLTEYFHIEAVGKAAATGRARL